MKHMKTLYLECSMGAAGDMLASALCELVPNPDALIQRLNNLHIPSVVFEKQQVTRCGIAGTHINVIIDGVQENETLHEHRHEHHTHHVHTGIREIEQIIHRLPLPEKVRSDASAVYHLLAEAESHAHHCEIEQIHFHEVGTMDAIADIVSVCLLFHELAPEQIIVSPIHVGSGQVRCAHGILPVPAPATSYLLRDIPIYSGNIVGELCTPTGAALIKHFADTFGPMPVMRISKIGYGMGTKKFEAANCLRAMIGETEGKQAVITELCCNIDDMTGEEIGFAVDVLLENGAKDVFTTPVFMKKNRPGILLTCLCTEQESRKFAELIFKYTSTIGVRKRISERYVLDRITKCQDTKYGPIRMKISEGYGVRKQKPEYDDIERAAKQNHLSLIDIKKELKENDQTK